MPCRAQGRPKTRIIWDRLGLATVLPTKNDEVSQFLEEESREELLAKAKIMSLRSKRAHHNASASSFDVSGDSVDDEDIDEHGPRIKRQVILDSSYLDTTNSIPELFIADDDEMNRQKRDQALNMIVSEFRQIMRDANRQETFDSNFRRRKKRDLSGEKNVRPTEDSNGGGEEESDDDDGDDGNDDDDAAPLPSDPTPILFFSTPSPTPSSSLVINGNGDLMLRDVAAKDQGWYACAGLNEAGSTVKRVYVRVLSSRAGSSVDSAGDLLVPQTPEPLGNRWGSEQNIIITSVTSTSSQTLDVTWDMTEGIPATTLTLHYRPISGADKEFQTTTAMIDSKEYTIANLKAYTEYEVFATVPQGLSGSVSNIRKGKTIDGPPTAPPKDVHAGIINNTTAFVKWSPPPSDMLNGVLTGYKVREIYKPSFVQLE